MVESKMVNSKMESKMVDSKMLATKNCTNPPICIKDKVLEEEKYWGSTPLFQRLQRRLSWWVQHASPQVVEVIKHGIKPPWVHPPPLVNKVKPKGGARFKTSTSNFDYLSRVRGNQSGERFQFKTSDSMVFNIKTRKGGRPNGD
jgi:hypothetical protein